MLLSNIYSKDSHQIQMPHADYRDIRVCAEEALYIRSKIAKRCKPSLILPKGLKVKKIIFQKEWAVLGPRDEEQYITTSGIGPCIGLVMCDLGAKIAGMAHIDAATSIRPIVKCLLSRVGNNARASLVGGNILEGWQEIQETEIIPQLVLIRRCLDQAKIEIADWDVMNSPGEVHHIVVDKNTGIVYNSI